jgi:hypothetical protein
MRQKVLLVLALAALGCGIAYLGSQADQEQDPPLARFFTETTTDSVRDLIREAGR